MYASLSPLLRGPAVWALACLSLLANQAFAAPTSVNFGPVSVGQTSAAQTVTVNFSQSGQIKAVKAVLNGSTGLDFNQTGGTCQAGSTYQAGQSCTVQATFTPVAPGVRNGAIVLTNPADAIIATAYLTGIGQGPLATFPGGTPVLAGYVGSSNSWTIDGAGNIYYLVAGYPNDTIHKLTPSGSLIVAWLPLKYRGAFLQTIDGAGNLILTFANQVIKIDPSGVLSLLATIQPEVNVGGVAALGNGNLEVGGGTAGSNRSVAAYYLVQPNGTSSVQGTITDPVGSLFIYDVAIGPAGETYLGTVDSVYNSSSGRICQVPNEHGIAVDASGTLLTGTSNSQNFYLNPTPTNCAPTVPVLDQLPLTGPIIESHGDIYVESATNTARPVYKYIRTQIHGVTFASAGTATSYGSMAITNSGNMPLNLSKFQPTLSGSSPQSFNIEGTTCSQSLAPAATCTVSLSYTPSGTYATLPASASLILHGLQNQQQAVPLNGFPNQ
ncbi:MAG TPA: choice-of-anchor D domain-containing protein [Silvibacterium sp.]|nr:choice-of-anchor D domain-containing protein [Silvibacterium sp.]